MSDSQLTFEYKDMTDRHELYAKYGIAAESAQLFETDLGTLLLCLQALEKGWYIIPDGVGASEVLDSINSSTLGRLLKDLRRHIKIEGAIEDEFMSALEARNLLMHGFFERHNFDIQTEGGREKMIASLDHLHGKLFAAWQTSGKLTTIISQIVRLAAQGGPHNA